MNTISIIGNLTRDPELKFTASETPVCSFSIAVNKVYKKDGEKVEQVSYFDCEAWSGVAETIGKYFSKGKKIAITGELKQDRWQDSEGKTKSKVKIVVNGFDFVDGKSSGDAPIGEVQDSVMQEPPVGDNPFSDDDIPF